MVYLKWLALQADAFRGHGLSLEAQDGQMQTLRQDVANLVCLTRKSRSLQGLRRTGCTSTDVATGRGDFSLCSLADQESPPSVSAINVCFINVRYGLLLCYCSDFHLISLVMKLTHLTDHFLFLFHFFCFRRIDFFCNK